MTTLPPTLAVSFWVHRSTMKAMRLAVAAAALTACVLTPRAVAHAYTITATDPSTLDFTSEAMLNTGLGLTLGSEVFEDFDDAVADIPFTTTSNPADLFISSAFLPGIAWVDVPLLQWNAGTGETVTFLVPGGGTSLFGLGISDQDRLGHTIAINGGPETVLDGLAGYGVGGGIPNGYILVTPDAGDLPITTVTITQPALGERLLFDHVVFRAEPVPEPTPTLVVLSLVLGLAVRWGMARPGA